jgi:hypothetical protein
MRRPVGVKWVLLFFRWTSFFSLPGSHCRHPFIRALDESLPLKIRFECGLRPGYVPEGGPSFAFFAKGGNMGNKVAPHVRTKTVRPVDKCRRRLRFWRRGWDLNQNGFCGTSNLQTFQLNRKSRIKRLKGCKHKLAQNLGGLRTLCIERAQRLELTRRSLLAFRSGPGYCAYIRFPTFSIRIVLCVSPMLLF